MLKVSDETLIGNYSNFVIDQNAESNVPFSLDRAISAFSAGRNCVALTSFSD